MERARIPAYEDVSKYYVFLCKITAVLPLEVRCTFVKYLPAVYFHLANWVYYSMHTVECIRLMFGNKFKIDFVFESILIHGLCSRFLFLYLQRAQVNHLMAMCQQLWRLLLDDEGKNVERFEKKVRYLMYYFMWTTLISITFYNISAHNVRLPPTTVNGTERRILPSGFYVDVQKEPWYQIVWGIENILYLTIVIIIMTIETVGPFFIMMACGCLRAIRYRLISMTWELNGNSTKIETPKSLQNSSKLNLQDVTSCVHFHQKVMEFCEKIDKLTCNLFLIQILCTTYNISLIGIRLVQFITTFYITMGTGACLKRGIQSFTKSEIIVLQSKAISNATYSAMLSHPTYDPKANKMLLFMMMRAQKPVELRAGGYVRLSLETFGRMCTNAVSFFTVLRSVNEEENS